MASTSTDPCAVDENITKQNIENIEKDVAKYKLLKQTTIDLPDKDKELIKGDADDLVNYMHEDEDGLRILDDTATINRKAIYHDLDRYKRFKESIDLKDLEVKESSNEEMSNSIMDKNIDKILELLPTVEENSISNEKEIEKASERLNKIELKIERKYSLRDKLQM